MGLFIAVDVEAKVLVLFPRTGGARSSGQRMIPNRGLLSYRSRRRQIEKRSSRAGMSVPSYGGWPSFLWGPKGRRVIS